MSISLKKSGMLKLGLSLVAMTVAASVQAKTLVYCSEGSPEGFNPQLFTSGTTYDASSVPIYNRLVEFKTGTTEVIPGLAEKWDISPDGKTYTFHIRQGAKWVDAQGREVADVKAADFVAGMQHMLDAGGGLEYLVENIIVNALEYNTGDVTDFAEVGVNATDDNTVVYTLCKPTSYVITMLGYNVFAPMSRTYFESKGGVFGKDDYKAAVDAGTMKYGQTVNDIAYCGPYRNQPHRRKHHRFRGEPHLLEQGQHQH